jgi:patatin-like phospholipase/acyl hydrolase
MATRKQFSVLAIDGGGIRGIIPARALIELERKLGRPVCKLFDIVAGTSTGGIIALGLTKPKDDSHEPQYAASDLLPLYTDDGARIFPHSLRWSVASMRGMIDERYPTAPLEALLRDRFGATKLSEALTEVVIPSYDLTGPAPFFFKRTYARDQNHSWDVDMWRVARATSAAPTYFEPAELPQFEHEGDHALVDGGVMANNPGVAAYAEALALYPDDDAEITVVSIGTGQAPAREPGESGGPISYRDAQHWGFVKWARPMLHTVLDGVAKTVDYELTQLCRPIRGRPSYYRLESNLPTASAAMDDVDADNIRRLLDDAETLLHDQAETFEQICQALNAIAVDRESV